MRLSNLAPHSLAAFDNTSHFTVADVFFTRHYLKLLIKWSKTIQDRSKTQLITLPKLSSPICPYLSLHSLSSLYEFSPSTSLFQFQTVSGWISMTDTRVRKCLKSINIALGFSVNFYAFHSLHRSGSSFAYKAQIPVPDIMRHGTWSSDCVWRYIHMDHTSGESLARSMYNAVNASTH